MKAPSVAVSSAEFYEFLCENTRFYKKSRVLFIIAEGRSGGYNMVYIFVKMTKKLTKWFFFRIICQLHSKYVLQTRYRCVCNATTVCNGHRSRLSLSLCVTTHPKSAAAHSRDSRTFSSLRITLQTRYTDASL